MSATYSDVDSSADPAAAVAWQEVMEQWPQIKDYKNRVLQLVAGCDRIIDIGCGPGGAVLGAGVDRCLGVERSSAMAAAASARGATVCLGDAHHLPFRAGRVAAVFADRVLQHVESPVDVLQEATRLLRSGGRLVVADPDQNTLSIRLRGVSHDLVKRVKGLRRDVGYRNGTFVASVPDRLSAMGFTEVKVDPFPLALTDPRSAFGVAGWPGLWRDVGGFTDAEIQGWERAVERAGPADFRYSLTYFVVSGRRP